MIKVLATSINQLKSSLLRFATMARSLILQLRPSSLRGQEDIASVRQTDSPESLKPSYWKNLKTAWQNRKEVDQKKLDQQTLDFMPASLEILESPPSPMGKLLGATIITFFTIAVAWACIGEVDIVAVAEGKIISGGRIKSIQPLEKGVVKSILVAEGQEVVKGQPLVELDQVATDAEVIRIEQELRHARLAWLRGQHLLQALQNPAKIGQTESVAKNNEKLIVPTLRIGEQLGITLTSEELPAQQALLQQAWADYLARLKSLQSQKQERIASLATNSAQISQIEQTLPLINRRTEALKKLVDQKMAPEMDYLTLEQSRIEQEQMLKAYRAQRLQYQAAIETANQQIDSLKAEKVKQVLEAQQEYERQQKNLFQELTKANDIKSKQILYAPVDGIVQQLAIHTVGGVVMEAQELMKLVPKNDFLEVEAVLENKDIGFVFEGQPAEVKINTFNFTKYGVIDATVIGVTPDAVIDEVKGLVYKLRLKLESSDIQVDQRLVELLPGMTVMAEVKTGKRQLIEYVMSPLLRKVDESAGER
ncbi:HlyD family type I secretion periplasmic adaptor subunit [Aestuariicella sp. G3-2]|uniref:HlyD family type I secretion periplasmic adaptor subunit n=1 Tax=Pseudomaricurvus albidus TaxID=2842452 RepID=UPI001C0D448F|nr:HlyD family type I secretion periplasmic adaptor subunit [Aestuariicella albida]MBU3068276.1 HlyD family type I secretion periplasmic adaptor subunit [Aestuariicella albida]